MPVIFAEVDLPLTFSRFEALPEGAKAGYYPGVLVVQKGNAKGHFAVQDGNCVVNYNPGNPDHAELTKYQIVIGDITLEDVVKCGQETGSTKCKLDHGATVRDIIGDYAVFRRDGDRVRADLTLMDSTQHRAYVEELFAKFAKKIGNSIDFDYAYEITEGVAVARCNKLNSVDIVDTPAATKSLFSSNPSLSTHMPLDSKDLESIGNLIDTKLGVVKTEFSGQITTLTKRFEEGDGETEDEKKKRKEKEDADADKGGMSTNKMSELAEKAAMSAMEKVFPKAQREQFATLTNTPGESPFEKAVQAQLSAGAANRGVAMQRVARDMPSVYNAHMAKQGA